MYYNTDFEKVVNVCGLSSPEITREEALFDLDYYMFLLISSCASFNLFYHSSSDNRKLIDSYYKNAKRKISSFKRSFPTLTFLDIIQKIPRDIKDLHSVLVYRDSDKEKWGMFTSPLIPFYSKNYCSDELLAEVNAKDIEDNSILEKNIFYKVPIKGLKETKYRLLKVLKAENSVQTFFDETVQQDFVRSDYDGYSLSDIKKTFTTSDSDYWILPDCRFQIDDFNKIMDSLCVQARNSHNKKVIFIDSRFNYGGSPYRYIELLFSLFGLDFSVVEEEVRRRLDNLEVDGKVLISKPIIKNKLLNINEKQGKLRDFWLDLDKKIKKDAFIWLSEPERELSWEYNPQLLENTFFSGLIVVAISNESMSFGELIFDYIRDVLGYKNIILVGEKSKGAVSYGNINTFYLPNSKIRLCLSSAIDYDKYKKDFYENYVECRGFIPSYWATNSTEYVETLKIILNEYK